jgi:hypothetical protein
MAGLLQGEKAILRLQSGLVVLTAVKHLPGEA